MLQIIVLDKNVTAADTALAESTILEAAAAARVEIAGIAATSGNEMNFVLNGTSAASVLFVDIDTARTPELLSQIIREAADRPGAIRYAAFEESVLPELRTDTLITAISQVNPWPLGAVALPIATIRNGLPLEGSVTEFIASLLIRAAIEGEAIETFTTELAGCALEELSDDARARLLGYAVNACNIEELFPNHAWQQHEEESAAACYHTLAALFIRFGDLDTAKECLAFSDRLEDSPRSLALRALIALSEGETLGAVANLISSLQQYEIRKRNENNTHYLSFSPPDLAAVNTELHEGLNALNKQDNRTALNHFAAAVFHFDGFYRQNGLDGLVH